MEYAHPNTIAPEQGFESLMVSSRKVACDGGGGALGHPRVFLKMEMNETSVTCPYCSRRFVYQPAS